MAKRSPKFKNAVNTKPSLEEAFKEFEMEKLGLGRSPATVKNYRQSFEQFNSYHGINASVYLLEDLTEGQFYKWRQHMIENEVRPTSINHYIRDWRTFLNWCYEKQLMEEKLVLKEMKHQEEQLKMYKDEELELLLTKPLQGDSYTRWRDWAIVNLIYGTGLRASSVCSLTIGCVDLEKQELIIPQQKNKKASHLPIGDTLKLVLREYMRKWLKDEEEDNYLFQSYTGEQLTVNALHTSINKLCARYGFKGHGVHSIRHNFAKDMAKSGAGAFRLQAYLQHSNIQMSQHYVRLFSDDLREGMEQYNPLELHRKKNNKQAKFKKG